MKGTGTRQRFLTSLLLGAAALWLLGCPSDSPTKPSQQPGPPPGSSPPSAVWRITLTADPAELTAGATESVTITITVRRVSNNQPPPDGTTILVSTTLGEFNSLGSGQQSGRAGLVGGVVNLALFPGGVAGTAVVQAQLEGSVGQINVPIRQGAGNVFLSSVAPSTGSPQGGETVTVNGGNFRQPVRVTFGGNPAEILSLSPSSIRVRTPVSPSPVGTGETLIVAVTVTVGVNQPDQQSDTLANGFTYVPGGGGQPLQPQVFSVTPGSGPNEGGTRVTINGDGFAAPVQVLFGLGALNNFNGVEATVESVSRTRLVVRTPSATGFGQGNQNQLVSVLVRNLNSGFATVFPAAFKYGVNVLITAISPAQGPFFGGQLVTLFGQGFDEPVAVGLAGFAQQIISVTGTQVVVRTVAITTGGQCQDVSGPSELTNIETGDGAQGPGYIYLVAQFTPFITSLAPSRGAQAGGTVVTALGGNFIAPLQVTFTRGGLTFVGSFTIVSAGELRLVTPAVPDDAFEEEDCDTNGDGATGKRFIPTSFEVKVKNLATGCEAEFPAIFEYTPGNTLCRNEPPPPPPDPPEANFVFTSSGLTVIFSNTSTNATSFVWDFGDSTTSTLRDPVKTYGAPGTFTVTLTARNALGQADSISKFVTVP